MSYNGSGQFVLVAGNPVVTGTVISSTTMNNTLSDIATGLSTAVTKDGQTTPTANIPLGGFKLTGLGAATANGDAVRYQDVGSFEQNQTFTAFTTGGTSTAYTLTPSPAITAYTAGQSFFVTFNAASGAAPTLAISAIATPPNLVKQNGDGTYSNIAALDIPINHRSRVTLLSATQALVETMPAKRLVQIQTLQTGAVATGTTVIPVDDTIPQQTEGDQYMSLAITPVNAASSLEIDVVLYGTHSTLSAINVALFRDATANAIASGFVTLAFAGAGAVISYKTLVSASAASATTFKVRAGSGNAGTFTFNGGAGARLYGGTLSSSITIKEWLP